MCGKPHLTQLYFKNFDAINTSVSFSCCANLIKLSYIYHKLTQANLIQNCTALTNIVLYHGRLTVFPDIRFHNMLERIDLTYNKISLLTSDMLPKSGFLTYIRLEHNSFKTLPDIPEMFTNSLTANLKVCIYIRMCSESWHWKQTCPLSGKYLVWDFISFCLSRLRWWTIGCLFTVISQFAGQSLKMGSSSTTIWDPVRIFQVSCGKMSQGKCSCVTVSDN